jgi:hypothetical protein
MSNHETVSRADNVKPGSDRSFGLVVGGILLMFGMYQLYKGSLHAYWILAPAGALLVVGLIVPAWLHPLNVAWTQLGLLLGRIVTPVVMLFVYVLTIVPIGVFMRLMGKNLLRRKQDESLESYWIPRTPPGPPPESLEDQF